MTKKVTLLAGTTYAVMGLKFERGTSQIVRDEKKTDYLATLTTIVTIESEDGAHNEERPLFKLEDVAVDATTDDGGAAPATATTRRARA